MSNQTFLLEKPLPSAPDAERGILGAILISNELIAQAAAVLAPDDFYAPLCRRVFAAMLELFGRGEKIDAIMIGEEIKRLGFDAASLGGIAAIGNLTYGLPHFTDVSDWIALVKDTSKARKLIGACAEIQNYALDETEPVDAAVSFAQSKINEISFDDKSETQKCAGTLAIESLHKKIAQKEAGITVTGLKTGFAEIDRMTNGLAPELIILGARPKMGKSSIMLGLAENIAYLNEGAVVQIFSLEMSKEILIERALCSSAKVDAMRFKRAEFGQTEAERLATAAVKFESLRIEIDDTPALSPAQMKAKSLMTKAKYKGRLDLIIVDFLQKASPNRRRENTRLDVASIAADMKNLVKELKVPALVLSSLSRKCESRENKRPMLSDLSESNAIESEADQVWFLFREHYYRKEANEMHAEVIFAKNRNGPEDVIDLAWHPQYTRFENWN